MTAPPFIAVDWGTSRRRAYRIEQGEVTADLADDRGAKAVTDFPTAAAELRAALGELPMLMAGTVGATIGWATVPYVPCPAGLADLAAEVHFIDDRSFILPGVSQANPPDIMRSEEVMALGAVAANMVPPNALVCQPGTHTKWMRLQNGYIAEFTSAMTGELFGLLRDHSLLGPQLLDDAVVGEEFRAGVRRGAEGNVAAHLFAVRSRALVAGIDDSASFASGVLIGNEVAGRLHGEQVHLLSESNAGDLYADAIVLLGGSVVRHDSRRAFLAGITRLWEMMS